MNHEINLLTLVKWTTLSVLVIIMVLGIPAGLWLLIPTVISFWMIPRWYKNWQLAREQKKIDAEFDRVIGFDHG